MTYYFRGFLAFLELVGILIVVAALVEKMWLAAVVAYLVALAIVVTCFSLRWVTFEIRR